MELRFDMGIAIGGFPLRAGKLDKKMHEKLQLALQYPRNMAKVVVLCLGNFRAMMRPPNNEDLSITYNYPT